MSEIQNPIEKFFTSALLFESAGKACAILDSFSGWLLGGFAAAIILLITQLASLTQYIPLSTIRCCLILFLVSVFVALIQKYISLIILAGSQSAAFGREMLTQAPFNQPDFNPEVIFTESERALFPPMRWFVRRSFAKVRQGELTAGAITFVRWVQIQSCIVLVQAVLLLWAILAILGGLRLVEK